VPPHFGQSISMGWAGIRPGTISKIRGTFPVPAQGSQFDSFDSVIPSPVADSGRRFKFVSAPSRPSVASLYYLHRLACLHRLVGPEALADDGLYTASISPRLSA
jgi:hypothetical protein